MPNFQEENLIFENWITKQELSSRLSLSISSIDRLMKRGLPYHKLGRSVRFNFEDVKSYLQDWRQNGPI